MHYLSYAVIKNDPSQTLEEQISTILGPHEENYDGDERIGVWDWYQIGGRWTGHFDSYDPTTDPANIGPNSKTKWPTDWKRHSGDIIALDTLPDDDEHIPYTLFVSANEIVTKQAVYDHPNFAGWPDRGNKKKKQQYDALRDRINIEHKTAVRQTLSNLKGKNLRLVVVDYHN